MSHDLPVVPEGIGDAPSRTNQERVAQPHTPGPWALLETETSVDLERRGKRRLGGWQDIGTKRGRVVAIALSYDQHCYRDGEAEAEANARLIIAAPTMARYIAARAACGDLGAIKIMEVVHGRG